MSNAQHPILTVTLNPALDLSARVDAMVPNIKLRLRDPVTEPGGGGVNVARAIHALGGQATAWVALAGASGAQHGDLMRAQGLALHLFDVVGETRATWAVTDAEGQQFRLQLPGPDWSEGLGQAALDDICAQARQGFVVLSGSQPPGLPESFAQGLAARLRPDRLIIDTSGPALEQVLAKPATRPLMLRLDQSEIARMLGGDAPALEDIAQLAQDLLARGVAAIICIARGAEGSVMATGDGIWTCKPPQVQVASKVGAGDSFAGAFVLALAQGQPAQEALRSGTAAAAAAVITEGSALCRAEDVARLMPDCTLARLAP